MLHDCIKSKPLSCSLTTPSATYCIAAQIWLTLAMEQVVQSFSWQVLLSTIHIMQADLFLLCRVAVNDTAVREHICKLTSLKHLSLLGCHHITDNGLHKLAQTAAELQVLDISSCRSA